MKYTTEVTIDLPRTKVVDLFDDPNTLSKWQQGLQSMEHISGEPGKTGAVTRLVYNEGGRTIEMKETIIERDLPETFSATYDANNVHNVIVNHFYQDGPKKTRWVMENEFQFSGFMRIFAFFMGGSFRRRTAEDMERFKKFAESTA